MKTFVGFVSAPRYNADTIRDPDWRLDFRLVSAHSPSSSVIPRTTPLCAADEG